MEVFEHEVANKCRARLGKANCIRKVDFMTFSSFHIALIIIFRIDSNHDGWLRLSKIYACYVDPIRLRKSVEPPLIWKQTSVL